MRRAARTDANHADIKRAFERMGCDVLDLSRVGSGCPDLLVQVRAQGRIFMVECKTAKGKMRPAQEEFAQRWPVHVVRSVEDAIGVMR